jgi:hypothetical protein
LPERASVNTAMLEAPLPPEQALAQELVKGPNIASLPAFPQLAERIEAPVLLKVGDDVSTDEISPAGARALPLRSNIPKLAEFTFTPIDPDYPRRAAELTHGSGHVVIGGHNYGQGSSREHAAITARYLSLHAVIAKSFARIHWQNLANFGILALEFTTEEWIAPHQGQLISPPSSAGTARLATAHHRNVSLTQRMSGSTSRSGAKRARLCGCGRTANEGAHATNPWPPLPAWCPTATENAGHRLCRRRRGGVGGQRPSRSPGADTCR